MDRKQFADWLAGYERAWRTPGTDSLAKLFTTQASYSTGPFEEPHLGLDAIAGMWEGERLGSDEKFEMESRIVAVEGDTGVARVDVRYGEPRNQAYRDLWIVRLDESGLCSHFEEWPFWPPGTEGTAAAGPSPRG